MNFEEKDNDTALVPLTEPKQVPSAPEMAERKVTEESYWMVVTRRYTWVWRFFLVATLIFAALFLLLFSRVFTHDSIFCFFRDLQSVSSFVDSDYDTVYATYSEGGQAVLSYRDGVAFVSRGGVEIFSPNGERLLNAERTLIDPRAVASRKYLLAYDNGGTDFLVTNSYSELFRGKTDFPIYGAATSDSGYFALITASDTYLSQVLLYDNNFNLVQRFNRLSATVGVSISDNGKRIALLGATATEGTVCTRLEIFRIGEASAEKSLEIGGEMPLSLGFTNDRCMMLLTNGALRCVNIDGNVVSTYSLTSDTIGYTVNGYGALLLTSDAERGSCRVLALDANGGLMLETEIEGDFYGQDLGDGEILLLAADRAVSIRTDTGGVSEIAIEEKGAIDIIWLGWRRLRVCYPARADYVVIGSNEA